MVRPAALALAGCAVLALAPRIALSAAPAGELGFRRHVADLVAAGTIDYDEGLLVRFQRVFAPDQLPSTMRGPAVPDRSATMLIQEYRRYRTTLRTETIDAIQTYLGWSPAANAAEHTTAHFRFTYETQGSDAVAPDDVAPANGVPDFVERAAEYAETSWTKLVVETGFSDPVPAGGLYPVTFREMSAFGYTEQVGTGTQIVLHRSFQGFPANQDPDGSVLGAAKVTAAHELKHASQWVASGWTEQGWLEADAVWFEDFVFDATNDYWRYLDAGSPVSHPDSWLQNGNASYEDCLWQHLLVETHGPGVLVDFFARRAAWPAESVTNSFDAVLRARGSSLRAAGERLGVWSYFCGANSWQRPVGFAEADSYPTPPLSAQLPGGAGSHSADLPGLGTHFVLVGASNASGRPWVQFADDATARFSVTAITLDKNGARAMTPIPTIAAGAGWHEVPVAWSDVALFALVLTNLDGRPAPRDYHVSVDNETVVGVDVRPEGGFALYPNRPNPFRTATTIAFSLPAGGPVRLAVYEVGGRLVRRLAEGERLPAGVHQRVWHGVDEAGRAVSPGVYYVRLETEGDGATRKMLLLR